MANGNKQIHLSIPLSDMYPTGDGQPFTETEKAYGFGFPNAPMCWIPKSQITVFEVNSDDYSVNFWLPSWLVEAKHLEVYTDSSFEPSLF